MTLTGAALLEAGADVAFALDSEWRVELGSLLRSCAKAFPIDPGEPPRNPVDRAVVLAGLLLAKRLVEQS